MKKMAADGYNVYLVKLGLKSLADGRQDICKDKESIWDRLLATKAESIQSLKLYFRFACETEDFVTWNFCLYSLSRTIFNALKRYYVWPWNTLMVINKIVFTSPEAMVEFSGENS